MKISSEHYARAFLQSRTKSVSRLLAVIKKHGDLARAKKIVERIALLLVQKAGGNYVTVEYARPEALGSLASCLGPKDFLAEKIVPELLAGARVNRNGSSELDLSFARKLQKLFPLSKI